MNEPLLKKERPSVPSLAPYLRPPPKPDNTPAKKSTKPIIRVHRQNRLRGLLAQYIQFSYHTKTCPFFVNICIGLFLLGHVAFSYFSSIVPCLGQPLAVSSTS